MFDVMTVKNFLLIGCAVFLCFMRALPGAGFSDRMTTADMKRLLSRMERRIDA